MREKQYVVALYLNKDIFGKKEVCGFYYDRSFNIEDLSDT